MSGMLPYLGALALFLACLRLSAFFSGAETGFYRVSYLRVSIDAQSGDPLARRILWFCQHPSDFVVTALIGNNVAQYGLTAAVGIAAVRAGLGDGMTAEIISTLFIAPFAFTFGELIPKNLYYRAPLRLLRRNAGWFVLFYRLFFPIGLPLMAVARVLQHFSRTGAERPGQILGRARLVQVLSQGHQEGLLLDVQGRLLEGLMHLAGQPVMQSVIPNSRVLGVPDNVGREDVLNFARRVWSQQRGRVPAGTGRFLVWIPARGRRCPHAAAAAFVGAAHAGHRRRSDQARGPLDAASRGRRLRRGDFKQSRARPGKRPWAVGAALPRPAIKRGPRE